MPRRPADIHPRLIVGAYGLPKSGKTHFCLTAPGPLRVINTDFGIDEVIAQHANFRVADIEIEDIFYKPDDHESMKAALVLFHQRFPEYLAYCNERAGTVIIDNATTLWFIIREVKLEEARRERFKKQNRVSDIEDLRDDRRDYGAPNAYYEAIIRYAYQFPNVNLILTHGTKTIYTPRGEETDQIKYDGFKNTPAIVQAMLRSYREGSEFKVLIESSRHDPDQCGLSWDNDFKLVRSVLLGEEIEARAGSPG